MKKIKFLALAFVIATSSLFAKEMIPDIPIVKVQLKLMELLETPDFHLEQDISTNFYISFIKEGRIKVLKIDSHNKDVQAYIHKSLDNEILKIAGVSGIVYKVPLKLKKSDLYPGSY
ncbi:MAG: hypothetical protein IZT56_11045 [Bacteroidetes bacterium]|nr:hypothetical protein [Bacteroidota bacterium]